MAEFTPNLDDGELWLPSDIVHDVGVRCHYPHHHYDLHRPSRNASVEGFRQAYDVEDLARQLAAAGLLDCSMLPALVAKTQPPPATMSMSRRYPHLHRQTGVGRFSCFGAANEPEVRPVYGRPSRRLVAGDGDLRLGINPLDQVAMQMEVFKLERSCGGGGGGRLVTTQRQVVGRPVRSRFGSGMGTGVFIPRVFNESGCKQGKKKPYQGKEEQMMMKQQQLTKNVIGLKQAMPFQAPLAEMDLPPDWTY